MGYSYNMFYFLKYSVTFLDILAPSIRGEPHCKPLKTWHIRIPRPPRFVPRGPRRTAIVASTPATATALPTLAVAPALDVLLWETQSTWWGRCFRVVTFHFVHLIPATIGLAFWHVQMRTDGCTYKGPQGR